MRKAQIILELSRLRQKILCFRQPDVSSVRDKQTGPARRCSRTFKSVENLRFPMFFFFCYIFKCIFDRKKIRGGGGYKKHKYFFSSKYIQKVFNYGKKKSRKQNENKLIYIFFKNMFNISKMTLIMLYTVQMVILQSVS